MAALTLTLIGRDRPGLVGVLAERVAAAGGNWLESRMARLAGQFAGVLLVEVDDAAAERLLASLGELESLGLRVSAGRSIAVEPTAERHKVRLELLGHDRPGIVREIAQALAGRGVNIEELTTGVASGAFSGERMFKAEALLSVPAGLSTQELGAVLEAIGHELMVDVDLAEQAVP